MIQQFESHPNKESFLQDLNQTEMINMFSGKSQKLIADMNNTEIFEMCETSSKNQCPECNLHWEIGIVYCTCGGCLKPSQRTNEFDMNNYDVLSIPGDVIKKNNSRGAKRGPSEQQRRYCKVKGMLQKARQPKHGGNKSMLERLHKDEQYRMTNTHPFLRDGVMTTNTESRCQWTEEQMIEYDKSALEDHSDVATRSERIQNTKHWVLRLNQDGAQPPLNQRHECKRLHDEYVTRTQQKYFTIPRDQQVRQRRGQPFEGIDEYDHRIDPRTGGRFCNSEPQGDLSSTNWDRNKWTTRSWNSWHSSRSEISWIFLWVSDQFRLPGDKLPDNRREVWTEHPLIQHVQMCTVYHHITLHSRFTFHHVNARGSRAEWLKPWCAQNSLSSTCYVSFLAAPNTDHQHMFSVTYLSNFSVVLSFTLKPFWRTIHIYPATIHGGVADPPKSHLPQPASVRFDIPRVIDTFLVHDIQIRVSRPCHIDVFRWNRECFFAWHVELTSTFILMTRDEILLNRPKVSSGFSVVSWFCRLRPFRFALKFSTEIFTPYRFFPASEWVLGIRSLSLTISLYHLPLGQWIHLLFLWYQFFFRVDSPDASNFSKSSTSAIRISRLQIPPAISSYPRKIPDRTFVPSWWSPDWSRGEIGWYSTIAPKRIIGPLNGSPNRLSSGAFPSARRSWTFRK